MTRVSVWTLGPIGGQKWLKRTALCCMPSDAFSMAIAVAHLNSEPKSVPEGPTRRPPRRFRGRENASPGRRRQDIAHDPPTAYSWRGHLIARPHGTSLCVNSNDCIFFLMLLLGCVQRLVLGIPNTRRLLATHFKHREGFV